LKAFSIDNRTDSVRAIAKLLTLQHTATHFNALQHRLAVVEGFEHRQSHRFCARNCQFTDAATHCITLQHTATPCNTLQHRLAVVEGFEHRQWH